MDILRSDWSWDYDKVFVKPNIPPKKLKGAIGSYAHSVAPNEVLVLIDDTVFGGAKEGLILTAEGMYCKEKVTPPKSVLFSSNPEVSAGKNSRVVVNGAEFFKANIVDHLAMLTFSHRVKSCLGTKEPPAERIEPKAQKHSPQRKEESPAQVPRQSQPKQTSKLKVYKQDELFEVMKKMNLVDLSVGTFADILAGNKKKGANTVIKEGARKYVYKAVKHFRAFTSRCDLPEMENNAATIEISALAIGMLIKELSFRRVSPKVLESVVISTLREGLAVQGDIQTDPYANAVIEVATNYASKEAGECSGVVIVRLLCSNLGAKFLPEYDVEQLFMAKFESEKEMESTLVNFTARIEKGLESLVKEIDFLSAQFTDSILDVVPLT